MTPVRRKAKEHDARMEQLARRFGIRNTKDAHKRYAAWALDHGLSATEKDRATIIARFYRGYAEDERLERAKEHRAGTKFLSFKFRYSEADDERLNALSHSWGVTKGEALRLLIRSAFGEDGRPLSLTTKIAVRGIEEGGI